MTLSQLEPAARAGFMHALDTPLWPQVRPHYPAATHPLSCPRQTQTGIIKVGWVLSAKSYFLPFAAD